MNLLPMATCQTLKPKNAKVIESGVWKGKSLQLKSNIERFLAYRSCEIKKLRKRLVLDKKIL